jgi:hypothetical protein
MNNQEEFDFVKDFEKTWFHPLEPHFRAFHAARPEIYTALVRMTREMVARGYKVIGIKHLWERLRWEFSAKDLCNNYHAFYARLIMQQEPDLAGIFELREQRALILA